MIRLIVVYVGLIALTLLSAYVSNFQMQSPWIPITLVMGMVCVKFIMVVLEYMEMRKSNRIWKFSVIFPAILTAVIVGILAIV
jgi:heme/copper-type cytochrome/quinol oxidase subunit 4